MLNTKDNQVNLVKIWEELTPEEKTQRKEEQTNKQRGRKVGTFVSKETREKMSVVHTNPSEKTRAKMRKAKIGKKFSAETKKKLSEASKGKPKSKETKLKMSLAQKGKPKSLKHVENMTKARQNISKETKEKQRKAAIERTPEQQAQMTAGINAYYAELKAIKEQTNCTHAEARIKRRNQK